MFSSSKSTTADFYSSIISKLETLLNEQKLQRMDLAELKRLAYRKYDYYSTPPQTDQTTLEPPEEE